MYGVNGTSRVVGVQKVTVPAGTFEALVVTSKLTQPGFKFGSGTRTMWFAPGERAREARVPPRRRQRFLVDALK